MSGMRETKTTGSRRTYLGLSRGVLRKSKDNPRLQELEVEMFKGEVHTGVEVFHPFGFTSRPKGPSGGKHAEVLVAYLGGSRSHPVVIATADRRHRPKDLKEGETAIHDASGQMVRFTEDGVVVIATKKLTLQVAGVGMVVITKDKVLLGGEGATKRVKLEDDSAATKVYAL